MLGLMAGKIFMRGLIGYSYEEIAQTILTGNNGDQWKRFLREKRKGMTVRSKTFS